jgi:hypothetical protein
MDVRWSGQALAIQKLGTGEFVIVTTPVREPMPMTMSLSRPDLPPDDRFREPHTAWYATWRMDLSCSFGDGTADDHILMACQNNGLELPEHDTCVYMADAEVSVRNGVDDSLDAIVGQLIDRQIAFFSGV